MEDGKTDETDTQGKKPDTTSTDVKKPVEDKTQTEKVKEDLSELRSSNDEFERELLRKEDLRAKAQRGGRSDAGAEVKEKTQDEKDEEAAKGFMDEDE